MTRSVTHLTIAFLLVSLCASTALAFQKKGLLDFGDKFNLSEPKVDDSAAETA